MTEKERQDMRELDEIADRAGGYVAFLPDVKQHVDMRGLLAYCREKGIEPIDMTLREYNTFVISDAD